ncbi:hypothetical protein ISCGN_022079 [Ixodes scapularis]
MTAGGTADSEKQAVCQCRLSLVVCRCRLLLSVALVEQSFQGNSLVQAAEIPEETETVAFRNQAWRGVETSRQDVPLRATSGQDLWSDLAGRPADAAAPHHQRGVLRKHLPVSYVPRVAIPPRSSPQVTSDNQHGQASAAALGYLVSAASTGWMSRKIKQLENENRRLVRQAALQKTREATFRSHLHKIFTADQLAALSRSSNRWSKWSNETVKKSLQMRFACGSTGYELLLEGNFPLPSSRTLGRWLEGKFVVRLLKCFNAPC